MLTAIEQAAENAPKKMIRQTRDLARLHLDDPELQEAFYHMLKGTISRDNLRDKLKEKERVQPSHEGKGLCFPFHLYQ